MADVTASERKAIIRDLIEGLGADIPPHVVTGRFNRETFEIRKAAFLSTLDRIKHHVEQMKPWDDR